MEDGKYWYLGIFTIILVLLVFGLLMFSFFIINHEPMAPENLEIERQGPDVHLSWSYSESTDVYGYHIYRSQSFGDIGEEIAVLNDTEYVDHLDRDDVYYYVVRSYDGQFESLNDAQTEFYYDLKGPNINELRLTTGTNAVNSDKAMFYIISDSDTSLCRIMNYTEWFAYTGTYLLQYDFYNGETLIYFQCKDELDNIGDLEPFVLIYDNVLPNITKLSPETYLSSDKVDFDFVVSEQSACNLYLGLENVWSGKVNGSVNIITDLTNPNYVFSCTDSAGNVASLTGQITFKVAELLDVTINDGDSKTYGQDVELSIVFNSFVSGMECEIYNIRLDNGAIKKLPGSETFKPAVDTSNEIKEWELSPGYGTKYVYVDCLLDDKIVGSTFDSIYYDPSSEEDNNDDDGDSHNNNNNDPDSVPSHLVIDIEQDCVSRGFVNLELSADDAEECAYMINDWTNWESYRTSKALPFDTPGGLSTILVKYKCRNSIGESKTVSDTVIYDNFAPPEVHGLELDYNSGGYVYLEWDEVDDEVEYYIYRQQDSDKFRKVGDTEKVYYADYLSGSGTYSYYVVAVDCAGNHGESSDTESITVDTEKPDVEITNPSGDISTYVTPFEIRFEVTDETDDYVECEIDHDKHNIWSGDVDSGDRVDVYVDLDIGTNRIKVICEDEYGNKDYDAVVINLVVVEPEDHGEMDDEPPPVYD